MIKIEDILDKINDTSEKEMIYKAYEFAFNEHENMKRLTGDAFISHPLEVANIVSLLNVDTTTIIGAILHETINNGNANFEILKEQFGEEIAIIVDGVSKLNKLELTDDTESSAKYLRKILVGMAEDVRVLYIKLADRLHNMRTNYAVNPSKQKFKAKETMQILVPIAHRLGMNSIKSELENLSLQYLKPDVYNDILEKLNASAVELNSDLNSMKESISEILDANDIKYEIKGRVKSVHSIYSKLSAGKKWSDIYDILALRIFVEKEPECYTVVGLIHSKYRPIANRFKDYIASPKSNLYQSLHTTIFGENGKIFEIQIRTYEMDEIAEKGIASHWTYKEKGSTKVHNMMEQKLEMFRNIIETNNNESDLDFEKNIESDFLNESIFVYTPKGDVVELPKGATPIDFAYRIHSSVGDTTIGALVNDNIVPFSYELEDGDIVKIKTSVTAKPKKDWLKIVKTQQAKNKIKAYFNKGLKVEYISKGKAILERELRKKKIPVDTITNEVTLNKILSDLKLDNLEDLYFAIGSLRYTMGYIINLASIDKDLVQDVLINKTVRNKFAKSNNQNDIIIDGERNILVNLAKCCLPVKGDDIIGCITKGQGITIHKTNCANISDNIPKIENVKWNMDSDTEFITKLFVLTRNDVMILQKLVEIATKKNIYIVSFNTLQNDQYNTIELNLKIKNKDELEEFITALENIKNVKSVGKKIGDL